LPGGVATQRRGGPVKRNKGEGRKVRVDVAERSNKG